MKTLIGKYKELVDYYESMFDTIYKRFKSADEPEEWQLKPNTKGAILKSEIAELEQNNPALREELIAFAEFVNMKMPVITEKYIDEYLSSRQEKPNAKE